MANSRIILVFLAFGIIGCCHGTDEDYCKQSINIDKDAIKICENESKSNKYLKSEPVMNRFLKKHKDWLGSTTNNGIIHYNVTSTDGKDHSSMENCLSTSWEVARYELRVKKENGDSFKSYYIVQSEDFVQKIKYTRCRNVGADCFTNIFGYNGEGNPVQKCCTEKTAAMSLYVYDPKLGKIVYQNFDIPVACTCFMNNKYKL